MDSWTRRHRCNHLRPARSKATRKKDTAQLKPHPPLLSIRPLRSHPHRAIGTQTLNSFGPTTSLPPPSLLILKLPLLRHLRRWQGAARRSLKSPTSPFPRVALKRVTAKKRQVTRLFIAGARSRSSSLRRRWAKPSFSGIYQPNNSHQVGSLAANVRKVVVTVFVSLVVLIARDVQIVVVLIDVISAG